MSAGFTPIVQMRRLRHGEQMQSVGGPARTDPFYSLRDPNGSDLNKGASQEGGREESL